MTEQVQEQAATAVDIASDPQDVAVKKKSGTLLRLGPAIALIILGLGSAWLGGWYWAAIVAYAAVLMLLEWQTMTGVPRTSPTGVMQSAAAVASVGLVMAGSPEAALAVIGIGALGAMIAARIGGTQMSHAAAGLLYVGLPCIAVLSLRDHEHYGLYNILWLYAVVWAGDTGAYAFGRMIGGPKLAPAISPKKTWAGAIGGAAASIVAGVGAAALFGLLGNPFVTIIISLVVGIAAQIGDLIESAFKRSVNVKDSGSLLPGHGGALDRLDGFLAAVVFAWAIQTVVLVEGTLWGAQ